jgi:hypothetical protein
VERERLRTHFDEGFRELMLRDLHKSNEADVRMGTFIQCAAFIDALALAYSPDGEMPNGSKVLDGKRGIWKRYVDAYFPPEYLPVADAYHGFRSLLLHNFSAGESLGFTHDEPWRHLRDEGGRVVLDRGSFVAAVEESFEKFQHEVLADDVLGERVLRWLDARPPVGFWIPAEPQQVAGSVDTLALSGASFSTTSTLALTGTAPSSDSERWLRGPDRPRSTPKTSTIKNKPKKRTKLKKPRGRGKQG